MLEFKDIILAKDRIEKTDCVVRTSTKTFSSINCALEKLVGRSPINVVFKCDQEQSVGSFKIRGALNFVLHSGIEGIKRGFVTHSSGNHGLAVAYAARSVGAKAVVVVPRGSPIDKVEKIKLAGAELVECEPTLESRQKECAKICTERNMIEIPPFNHLQTMAGQGTLGLEIAEQVPDADVVIAAVGGCGMIAGVSTALKSINPKITIIGAEPSAVDDTIESLKNGKLCGPSDATRTTICDALRVNPPGPLCFEIVQRLVSDIIPVEDEAVIDAMRMLWKEGNIMTEPSGACATACLFSKNFIDLLKEHSEWKRIVVIICGRNIAECEFHKMIRD
jgi:threonine dehydratase